ncbi:MAG: DUF3160 domain-containing protein [Candidatus Korarchaeota archaeon]|nr:DUF3160 domain-containing protein [Candidatus Korarchaeota archaeon]
MRARSLAVLALALSLPAAAAYFLWSGRGGGGVVGPSGVGYELSSLRRPGLPPPSVSPARPAPTSLSQSLPLEESQLANPDAMDVLNLGPAQRTSVLERGFVLVRWGAFDDFSEAYEALPPTVPVYVTADTVLHAYHVLFDTTLAQIEEQKIYPDLVAVTRAMMEESLTLSMGSQGEVAEAARRNAAYFAVALSLLDPDFEPPREVRDVVQAELSLIESHPGVQRSPLFWYKEDYSQYIPRGHYTRSETLRRYFRAMMWYGRMAFLLRGGPGGFVTADQARMLTLQASLISAAMPNVELGDGRTVGEVWSDIYSVTAFFVGFADDLTPYDYLEALAELFGDSVEARQIPGRIDEIRALVAGMGRPKIYGGTGFCVVYPPFTEEDLAECLDASAGMRFMGQRYVPDSYVFQRLVTPSVGLYTGDDEPFTLGLTDGGPARVFPRGLDWFAVVGSETALQVMREEGDADYERYEDVVARLREEFSNLSEDDWSRNLYWSWLDALRILASPRPEGYPAYMRTEAWERRQLLAALASWSELRHDTILYAKQSYTPKLAAAPPATPERLAFVEPIPELYDRLLALTRQSREGLRFLGYLTEDADRRLAGMEDLLENLARISRRELAGEALSREDVKFLLRIGEVLEDILSGLSERSKSTVMVADVHTDLNSGLALEEGVGPLDLLVVIFPAPDGTYVAVGPVLTYYEFKHPISDRLTDESWRDMLAQNPPELPDWISDLYAESWG